MLPQENIPLEDLRDYINDKIVPNGMGQVDAIEHNNVENALLTAIEETPLNFDGAKVVTDTGDVFLSSGVTVFADVPISIDWGTNFQKQWKIVNRTDQVLPLKSGTTYLDQYGDERTSVPALMTLSLEQLESGQWVQTNNIGGGGTDIPNEGGETDSILTEVDGTLGRVILSTLKISEDAGNGLEVRDDGVYVANNDGTTQSFIVTIDS